MSKPRIIFPFVEAGMGHIMPMTAVCDFFEKKYGDRAEVVRTKFFQDTLDPNMKLAEEDFVNEVKKHNKNKMRGSLQFALMRIGGSKNSLKFLMETRYKKCLAPALKYLSELKPDLVFNTHLSTLYYANKLRADGVIDADVVAYCPDPIIGRQWDQRSDLIALSSELGKQDAKKMGLAEEQLKVIPFLIRKEVEKYDKGRAFYRKELNIPEDNFTILMADGAYGAGKLRKTVLKLLGSKKKFTLIAVCGKNVELFEEFKQIKAPDNICFVPFGFTDKMLTLSASCDLFIGKAGASNLAEPAYFGAPQIVNFCATPIEEWICRHYTTSIGSAIKIENINKAVATAEKWMDNPALMQPYIDKCASEHRTDGAEQLADILWERLKVRMEKKSNQI